MTSAEQLEQRLRRQGRADEGQAYVGVEARFPDPAYAGGDADRGTGIIIASFKNN